jgi:LPXTG-motif cell wall-anchored protein
VDAVLDVADTTVELTTTLWLWQRGVVLVVALGLLLLTSAALVTVRRRRRHAYAASEAMEQERR